MTEVSPTTVMPTYEEMLKSGMHYGRKKTVRHPNMKPFIYAMRDSIHIIDVIKTEDKLQDAIKFLKKVKDKGGMILWAGITKQSEDKIIEIAKEYQMPYVVARWLGGTLTNFKTLTNRVKYLEEMESKVANKDWFESLSKKERIDIERELKKLKEKFEGSKLMTRIPDALFISSLRAGDLPIREAKRIGVKTIAIVNTESDPTLVDYPIPANDNARSSVELVLETIRKALAKDKLNLT